MCNVPPSMAIFGETRTCTGCPTLVSTNRLQNRYFYRKHLHVNAMLSQQLSQETLAISRV